MASQGCQVLPLDPVQIQYAWKPHLVLKFSFALHLINLLILLHQWR